MPQPAFSFGLRPIFVFFYKIIINHVYTPIIPKIEQWGFWNVLLSFIFQIKMPKLGYLGCINVCMVFWLFTCRIDLWCLSNNHSIKWKCKFDWYLLWFEWNLGKEEAFIVVKGIAWGDCSSPLLFNTNFEILPNLMKRWGRG